MIEGMALLLLQDWPSKNSAARIEGFINLQGAVQSTQSCFLLVWSEVWDSVREQRLSRESSVKVNISTDLVNQIAVFPEKSILQGYHCAVPALVSCCWTTRRPARPIFLKYSLGGVTLPQYRIYSTGPDI